MIQKRFQTYTNEGIVWSDWYNFIEDDSKLEYLQKEEKYQYGKKLLNEYRIVTNDK